MPDAKDLADVRVEMAACRVDKEGRLSGLETWKKEQNGELKRIRVKGSATLIAIILLLIGVVANLAVTRLAVDRVPLPGVEEVVLETIETQLVPIVEEVVRQVVRSTAP